IRSTEINSAGALVSRFACSAESLSPPTESRWGRFGCGRRLRQVSPRPRRLKSMNCGSLSAKRRQKDWDHKNDGQWNGPSQSMRRRGENAIMPRLREDEGVMQVIRRGRKDAISNGKMMEARFVARYGATRFIGEFSSKGRDNYPRNCQVLVRSDRGV